MSFGVLGEHGRGVTEHFGVNVSTQHICKLFSSFVMVHLLHIALFSGCILIKRLKKCSVINALLSR